MLLLRCTQRLLKGAKLPVTADPPEPSGPLSEWYVNRVPLPLPGRTAVIFTSVTTLLTVITPARAIHTALPLFRERLPRFLARLDVPGDWTRRQMETLDDVVVAKTANRRVLGSMNDLAYLAQGYVDAAPSFPALDLDFVEMRTSEAPMSFLDYESPARLVATLAREG
ncbi:MAG TPA: hypothetical protein VFE05_02035 [Longimicrobiaceae bacterium]|jgi:hypothetical protein|nr:hypothetical protein [Longimicrobiaceae bacterium]